MVEETKNVKNQKKMRFGGLYADDKRCAVFVFPTKWDAARLDVAWHVHGAFPEGHELYGTDWASVAVRTDDATVELHYKDCALTGALTDEGVVWSDGVVWTKMHVVGAQLAVFRRPPVPLFCTMLLFDLVASCVRRVRAMLVASQFFFRV